MYNAAGRWLASCKTTLATAANQFTATTTSSTIAAIRERFPTASDLSIPSCIQEVGDQLFLVSATDAEHTSCGLKWLDALASKTLEDHAEARCLVVHLKRDLPLAAIPTNFSRMYLTVLDVPKSRFPGFALSHLAEMCASIELWTQRSSSSWAPLLFYSPEGATKPLFAAMAYYIWTHPNEDAEKVLEQFRERAETSRLTQVAMVTHMTQPVPYPMASCLFPSQWRMLQYWRAECSSLYEARKAGKSAVTPSLQFVLQLAKLEVSWATRLPTLELPNPVLELWMSNSTVYTTDPKASKGWLRNNDTSELTIIPLLVDVSQTHTPQTDSTTSIRWEFRSANFPKFAGDFLIRFLPSLEGDSFNTSGLPNHCRGSPDFPEWMLRAQFHTRMFSSEIPTQKIRLTGADLDGFDFLQHTPFPIQSADVELKYTTCPRPGGSNVLRSIENLLDSCLGARIDSHSYTEDTRPTAEDGTSSAAEEDGEPTAGGVLNEPLSPIGEQERDSDSETLL